MAATNKIGKSTIFFYASCFIKTYVSFLIVTVLATAFWAIIKKQSYSDLGYFLIVNIIICTPISIINVFFSIILYISKININIFTKFKFGFIECLLFYILHSFIDYLTKLLPYNLKYSQYVISENLTYIGQNKYINDDMINIYTFIVLMIIYIFYWVITNKKKNMY